MTIPSCLACAAAVAVLASPVIAGDWPSMRGPNHDGSAAAGTRFAAGDGIPAVRWRARLGSGYSGIAVAGGKAVTMSADGAHDVLIAFDVDSGKEAWRVPIAPTQPGRDGSFDGPIATPAIAGGRVFAFGPRGQLVAADLATGRVLWRFDSAERDGARKPHYGFGSSPIVAGGVLVAQIGGENGRAIAGFDPATGERRWTAGNDTVQYQSPARVMVGAREVVVAVGDARLYGIDPATGRILFEHAHGGVDNTIAVASAVPVPAGDGRVFVKTHQDKSSMFRITEAADGALSVQPVWSSQGLRNTYVVPVYYAGHLYGMTGRTVLTCIDAATGEIKWRSREPGDGFPALAGGDIVFVTKERTLHVGPASPQGWTERARLEVFSDLVWTAPSVVGASVFARSHGELARVDWKPEGRASAAATPIVSRALARLLAEAEAAPAAAEKASAVDRFLALAPGGPLVEPPDRVVFLYRGEATDVGIASDLLGIRREDPMRRVPGTDLFFYEAAVDPDARVSYQFVRNFEAPIPDPRNPRRVPYGATEGSSVAMPGWKEPSHLGEAPAARQGRLEKVDFTSTARPGAKAVLHVYVPGGYDASGVRYPVAYVLDGDAAREQGLVPRSLDNLMPEKVAPMVAVFVGRFDWGPAKPRREEEAAAAASTLQEVVAFVDARFRTLAEPGARTIIATAFATQVALRAAFGDTGLFGGIGLQSVAMLDSDEAEILPLVREAAQRPLRVYHDWGRYDMHATREHWDMRVTNARVNELLRRKGYRPAGGEAPDGTGWASWRNRTDRLFAALFPPRP